MSFISEVTPKMWTDLCQDAEPQKPSVGKTVTVTEGKHNGKTGLVFWHGINKYSDAWRYCTDAQAHLRDVNGRYGYRVGIQTATEKFFVDADKVTVIL